MIKLLATALGAAVLAAGAAAAPNPVLLHPEKLTAKAPAVYKADFKTTKGTFVVTVRRAWAPKGADRFYNLVRNGFYDGQRIFRVAPPFVVQWGISAYPKVSTAWQNANIKDDPVTHSNTKWTISYATGGPDTRTTQVFVNLQNNAGLDKQGFSPFGQVTSGTKVIGKLYAGYDDTPTNLQGQMEAQGEAFFKKSFPKLDTILSARIER